MQKISEMYFTYILRSKVDSSFYIGYTNCLARRLLEHNSGKSGYTMKKMPWDLFYFETYSDKSSAIKREKFLKRQKNTLFYESLVKTF